MSGNVRQFGRPDVEFTMIRNDFVRDAEIKPSAFRIAAWVMSHSDEFRMNQVSIGKALGLNASTVRAAFVHLEELHYLVRVETRNEFGHRAPDDLYLNQQKFTEAERVELLTRESQVGITQPSESRAPKEDHSTKKINLEEDSNLLPDTSGDGALFDMEPSIPKPKGLTNEMIDSEFDAWYALYPRKVSKGQAQVAYRRARRGGTAAQVLTDGLAEYVRRITRDGIGKTFIKHPGTWLNGQCWNDEDAGPRDGGGATGVTYRSDAWDANRAAERDENGLTAEDRATMDKYGATVSYG